jgi:hypothetical protein
MLIKQIIALHFFSDPNHAKRYYGYSKINFLFISTLLIGNIFGYANNTKLRLQMGYPISSFQEVSATDAGAAISVYVQTLKDRIQKRMNLLAASSEVSRRYSFYKKL